jgi:hypothetical protein
MIGKIALFLVFILYGLSALAGTVSWWEWRNSTTGATVYAQTSPGTEWAKYSGPYSDLKCTIRGQVKN